MPVTLFVIGFLSGLMLAAVIAFIRESGLHCEHIKNVEEVRKDANWYQRRTEGENEKLKAAIATAQQALAEVRPPRTEHKVNY